MLPHRFYFFHPLPIMARRVPCDQDLTLLIASAQEILTAVHAAYRSKHVQAQGLHGDGSSSLTAWCLYAGGSRSSYSWVLRMGKELCNEYAFRFPLRQRHPSEQAFHKGVLASPPEALTHASPIPPPMHLVREFDDGESPVFPFLKAYASVLRKDATWTGRIPPVSPFRQITSNAWGLLP